MEFLNFFDSSDLRPYVTIQPRPYVHQLDSRGTDAVKKGRVQKAAGGSPRVKLQLKNEHEPYFKNAIKLELRNRLIARMARLNKLPNGLLATQALFLNRPTPYWNETQKGNLNGAFSGEEKSTSGKMFSGAGLWGVEEPSVCLQKRSCFVNGEDFDMFLEGRQSPLVPPPPLPLCEGRDVESLLNSFEGSILFPMEDFLPFC